MAAYCGRWPVLLARMNNRIAIAILIVALLCAYWLGDGGIAAW